MSRSTLIIVLTVVAAILLQIIIAPNIAIFSAMPSFLIVVSLVVSMLIPGTSAYVTAFVLGMTGDLLGFGPVGALPLLLLISSFCISIVYQMFDNDTLFVPLAVMMVFALLVELIYAGFVLANGLSVGFVEAFIYRALPCALYDCVIGLLLYPVLIRILSTPDVPMSTVGPRPRTR